MNMLFANTSSLHYIDIIKFNMINVINYDYMFYGIAEKGHIQYNPDNIPDRVIQQIPPQWMHN